MRTLRQLFLILSSILYWATMVVLAVALFPGACLIWLVTRPFDPRLRALHLYSSFWAFLYSWLNPFWSVKILNRQNIRPNTTYLLVANHRSLVDIFVLYRLFTHFKWVSKAEVLSVPVIGWNMRLNRYIAFKRGSASSVKQMISDCQAALSGGNSVMLFPEGTRATTDELGEFRGGAFHLAKKLGVPIVPIAVHGTGHLLGPRGVLLGRRSVEISVLPEVTENSYASLSAKALGDSIRQSIVQELSRLEGSTQEAPKLTAVTAGE